MAPTKKYFSPYDVVLTKDFCTDKDITFFPGDLFICGNVHFCANAFRVLGNLYLWATDDGFPTLEANSAEVHGVFFSNCFDNCRISKITVFKGCDLHSNY